MARVFELKVTLRMSRRAEWFPLSGSLSVPLFPAPSAHAAAGQGRRYLRAGRRSTCTHCNVVNTVNEHRFRIGCYFAGAVGLQ